MCPSYSDINHLCDYNPQECRFDKDCQGTTAKCCYASCNNIGWGNICVDPDGPSKLTLFHAVLTVLPAKSDSDLMFCLQSFQGLIIDRSLMY